VRNYVLSARKNNIFAKFIVYDQEGTYITFCCTQKLVFLFFFTFSFIMTGAWVEKV